MKLDLVRSFQIKASLVSRHHGQPVAEVQPIEIPVTVPVERNNQWETPASNAEEELIAREEPAGADDHHRPLAQSGKLVLPASITDDVLGGGGGGHGVLGGVGGGGHGGEVMGAFFRRRRRRR